MDDVKFVYNDILIQYIVHSTELITVLIQWTISHNDTFYHSMNDNS